MGLYIAQSGKFCLVNCHFCEYTGFSQDELLGTETLRLVHPEDREEVSRNAVAMLKGNRLQPYEFRIITRRGEAVWIAESVVSIIFAGKRVVLGSFMNITEHKQAEQTLLQQVFFNIVINAEFFMLEEHNKGNLTITTESTGDLVRCSITDDDPGISKEHMRNLFYPILYHQRGRQRYWPGLEHLPWHHH